MKNALFFFLAFVGLASYQPAQGQFSTTQDTALLFCGDSTILSVSLTGNDLVNTSTYSTQSIPFTPEPVAGTLLSLTDDSFVGPFPIGFSFGFFCNTYTQFWLSSNGWISFQNQPFGAGWNFNYTPNQLSDILPTTFNNVPKNCVMGPWKDWNPGAGGQVRYQTIGNAPCRKLVVTWSSVPMFSCGGNLGTFQIVLEETTNRIENHVTSAPFCNTWQFPNQGWGTQAIHNQGGTAAYWVGTRNATTWNATNESWRWQPAAQIYWYQNGVLVDSGNCITANPNVSGHYVAQTITCGGNTVTDSTFLGVSCIYLDVDSIDVLCAGDSTGSAFATDTSGTAVGPITWYWTDASGDTIATNTTTSGSDSLLNLPNGVYNVTADLGGGNFAFGQTTINAPNAMSTMPANLVNVSCNGSTVCDGQGSIIPSGGLPGYVFNWANGGTTAINFNLCVGDNYVTVTDANGCAVVDTVTIGEPPALQIAGSADTTICISNSHQLSATAIGGVPPYNFVWSTGQTGNQVTVTPTVNTQYTVQVIDSNGCQGPIDSITVSLNPALSVSASTADDTICIGDMTTLTAVGAGGDGNFSYAWSNGAPSGSPITVSPTSTTNYVVTVTDGCGTPGATDTIKVQVGGYPQIVASAQPWPVDTICPGESANLSASATGGFGTLTYTWSSGLGTGTNHTVSPIQSTTYSVTVSDACNSPQGVAQAFVQVGGYPNIQAATSPNGSDTICKGQFIELSAIAGGGVPPLTYTWSQGLGVGNNHFVSPNVTTTYNVVVNDACFSAIDQKSITIHVGDFLNPEFEADVLEDCVPMTVNFAPDSLVNGYSYEWDFGDGTVVVDNSGTVPHAYAEVGCFGVNLQVTTNLGCVTNLFKPCYIKSRPVPTAALSYDPVWPSVFDPKVTFTDESSNSFNRQWLLSTGIMSEDRSFSHFFPEADTGWNYIQLAIENEYGCTDTIHDSIFVKYESTFWIPKGFTPDGDNLNDVFLPIGTGNQFNSRDYEMVIFDRWGNEIFRTANADVGWNGAKNNEGDVVEGGVYVYYIRYKQFSGIVKRIRGTVTLVR